MSGGRLSLLLRKQLPLRPLSRLFCDENNKPGKIEDKPELTLTTKKPIYMPHNENAGKIGKITGKPIIPEDAKYVDGQRIAKPKESKTNDLYKLVIEDEIKPLFTGEIKSLELPLPKQTDILIIGGGIVGSSVAHFLKDAMPNGYDVTIVERDFQYSRASTMLSAGGVRHQFSVPQNVQMSMFTTEFLQNIKENLSVLDEDPPEVQFNHQGYLFMAPAEKASYLESLVEMQRSLGAKTELLSKSMLEKKYPWMNFEGIEVASYGTQGEGWFDPHQLLCALRKKNLDNGVRYCEGEITKFVFSEGTEMNLNVRQYMDGVVMTAPDEKEWECECAMIVNCAGPWAGDIARLAEIGNGEKGNEFMLPVEPRKRFVYVVHCPSGPTLDTPFTVDPSGVYFRREGLGGYYICGASPRSEEEEPDISNLDVDYDFYNDYIWPVLANRAPCFNNSKLKSAWAGYYDYNTFDQNLIIGQHPYYTNFYLANGMSGHGVQQGLAIGRATFEMIVSKEYKTIDLDKFEFDRILANEPIQEMEIV